VVSFRPLNSMGPEFRVSKLVCVCAKSWGLTLHSSSRQTNGCGGGEKGGGRKSLVECSGRTCASNRPDIKRVAVGFQTLTHNRYRPDDSLVSAQPC